MGHISQPKTKQFTSLIAPLRLRSVCVCFVVVSAKAHGRPALSDRGTILRAMLWRSSRRHEREIAERSSWGFCDEVFTNSVTSQQQRRRQNDNVQKSVVVIWPANECNNAPTKCRTCKSGRQSVRRRQFDLQIDLPQRDAPKHSISVL